MTNEMTARELGDRVGLKHIEVIRRIRNGQIHAKKLGWVYVIEEQEVARVKAQPWYERLMAKRQQEAS